MHLCVKGTDARVLRRLAHASTQQICNERVDTLPAAATVAGATRMHPIVIAPHEEGSGILQSATAEEIFAFYSGADTRFLACPTRLNGISTRFSRSNCLCTSLGANVFLATTYASHIPDLHPGHLSDPERIRHAASVHCAAVSCGGLRRERFGRAQNHDIPSNHRANLNVLATQPRKAVKPEKSSHPAGGDAERLMVDHSWPLAG
jgi:hypothetical protein